MNHMRGICRLWMGLVALGVIASAQPIPRGINIQVADVFEDPTGNSTFEGPIQVTITNQGPPLSGRIIDSDRSFGMVPVLFDVPTGGSKKYQFIRPTWYGPPSLTFATNRGTFTVERRASISGPGYEIGRLILYLSDTNGGLAWPPTKGQAFGFCLVQNAPQRAEHYEGVSAILLGQGTDQLSDEAVEALRLFALRGGTLVFLGTTGSAAVDDPRWKGVNPIEGRQPITFERPGDLGVGGSKLPGPIPGYAFERLRPGAREVRFGGQPAMAAMPFGYGLSVFWGLDPREPEIAGWDRRGRLMMTVVGARRPDRGGQFFGEASEILSSRSRDDQAISQVLSGLPDSTTVWFVLLSFVVAVGPINFFVLSLLKKPGWAWVTSPLIAAGFAGYFFYQARGLYDLPASSVTVTRVLSQPDMPESLAWTASGLFFPRAGQYDLGIGEVISTERLDYYSSYVDYEAGYDYERPNSGDFVVVDTGRLQVLPIQVTNLSFHRFGYTQMLTKPVPLRATWEPGGTILLANESPTEIKNIRFIGIDGKPIRSAPPLPPGGRTRVQFTSGGQIKPLVFGSGWDKGLRWLILTGDQKATWTAPKGNFVTDARTSTQFEIQIPIPAGVTP